MSLNHDGWNEIFDQLPIVNQVNASGFYDLTADKIKEISGREARLMAKIDFREQLPKIMDDEGLAILAINNGTYRIGRFDPFIAINRESAVPPQKITFPNNIITLNPQKLAHESALLDASLVSGILPLVFGEKVDLTIRGRIRHSPFSFALNDVQFPVDGVQIEVDGGYEGATTVNLVEAKVGSRSNINVRQLIYPQLAWEQTVGRRKTVKTFICFYQEPVIRYIPVVYHGGICFADHAHEVAFILEPEATLDLKSIKSNPDAHADVLDVPFPQADRFETVLAMFNIVVGEEVISKEDLLEDFDIEPRQIDYYANAMKFMGLVDIEGGMVRINDEGRRVSKLSHASKIKHMAAVIFCEPIFNHVLHKPNLPVPPELFLRWRCKSEKTRNRRLQTVKAWLKYFQSFSVH